MKKAEEAFRKAELSEAQQARLAKITGSYNTFPDDLDCTLIELGLAEKTSEGILRVVRIRATDKGRALVLDLFQSARLALYEHGLLDLKYKARFKHDYTVDQALEEVCATLHFDADEFERRCWRNPVGEFWFECSVCGHEVDSDHNCIADDESMHKLTDILRAARR